MAIEAIDRRTPGSSLPFHESKPNQPVAVPEEFLRELSTSYITSRNRAGKRNPDQDAWDANLVGHEEIQEYLLLLLGQKRIVEKPNNHPFIKPLQITQEQLDHFSSIYTDTRRFYVDMDFGSTGLSNVTPLEARTNARMLELAKILFHLGQGDRVTEADERIGKSKTDLEREKLIREATEKKALGLH